MELDEPRLVLPHVQGWRQPPPPVTFPLLELATWAGPRWMLSYDDGSRGTSLGSVTLAFGALSDAGPRRYTDVTTVVRHRAPDANLRNEPRSLNDVCEHAQFVLMEREAEYAAPDERLALSHKLLDALPRSLYGVAEGYVPERFRPSAELTVDGLAVPAFAATGTGGWALCADLGDILVAVTGDGDREGPVALVEATDLGPYPVATDGDAGS